MLKSFLIFGITLFCCFVFLPLILSFSRAASLGETFLFLERMQVDQSTEMVLLLTPSSTFEAEGKILKILFPGDSGAWCKVDNTSLIVGGISSTVIDVGDWSIDSPLPGSLLGKCSQHSGGDYIEITGIGNLSSGVSYGLKISPHSSFKTGSVVGNNIVSVQLLEGTKVETISFNLNLLSSDQVIVSAEVAGTDTITCTITESSVNLGTLYRGGAYITGSNQITTDTTSAFYWAVYGLGGGSSGKAGLYNSTGDGYLLSSEGVQGKVNLLVDEGFGMSAVTSEGQVLEDFVTSPGVFGSIGKGFENARLFLSGDTPNAVVTTSIYYGVRASTDALTGSYQEVLTYVCGGYIGD